MKLRMRWVFIAVAVIELAAFVMLTRYLGFFVTLILLWGLSAWGMYRLRQMGMSLHSGQNWQQQWHQVSVKSSAQPFMQLSSALLCLLPGLVTGVIGLVLMIPLVQFFVGRFLFTWVRRHIETAARAPGASPRGSQSSGATDHVGEVIDGEFKRRDESIDEQTAPKRQRTEKNKSID